MSFWKQLSGFSLAPGVMDRMSPHSSLHEEVITMLSAALTIYLVADLRDLARLGKATIDLEALQPPIDILKVLEIIKDNKETLKDSGAYKDIEERLTALENLKIHNSNAILDIFTGQNGKAKLVEFVDVNAKEELVHAITVNPTRKRITVTFRGSVTTKDFVTDAKVGQIKGEIDSFSFLSMLWA